MIDPQIEVKGNTYAIAKVDANTQFHLARRIAPILATMGISLDSLKAGATLDEDKLMTSLGPVTVIISSMPDDTVDYVTEHCMAAVKRRQVFDGKETWAPAARGTQMLFDDMDMPTMLRLVYEVLRVNLLGFF